MSDFILGLYVWVSNFKSRKHLKQLCSEWLLVWEKISREVADEMDGRIRKVLRMLAVNMRVRAVNVRQKRGVTNILML
jgi:hypothetical protein